MDGQDRWRQTRTRPPRPGNGFLASSLKYMERLDRVLPVRDHPVPFCFVAPQGSQDFDSSNPGNNLYVTGLSTRVSECHVIVDPRTRESRGFGFVTMETVEGAERCVKYLNRSVLEGRLITVQKAKRKRGRTPTPGRYRGARERRGRDRRRSRSYSPYWSRRRDRSRSRTRSRSRSRGRRDRSYSPYARDSHRRRRERSSSRTSDRKSN
ncbi:hypothetical protein C4D60_Mb01t04650 [Musa balbisiana]|uniref:RRM domain-containing protein n=1 Tax=Musa balbisiana TaxID=52838 RepID=A0A4S8JMA9_MUSBA|nr:hypothetical protein C4D60_Mb01t04650 [Musa balbisiana]